MCREVKTERIRGWISGKIALVVVIEINELGVTDIFLEPGERIDIVLAPVRGQLIKYVDSIQLVLRRNSCRSAPILHIREIQWV